jgi:hypothetical protein
MERLIREQHSSCFWGATMKTKYLSVVLAVALALALVPSVLAEEYSVPALFCHINTNDLQPHMSSKGRAYKNLAYSQWFLCALHRGGSAVDTNAMTDLYAHVRDGHTGDAVECHFRSCNSTQSACVNTSVGSSASDSGNAYVGNYWIGWESLAAYTDGVAYLKCDVPVPQAEDSGVSSYRWTD